MPNTYEDLVSVAHQLFDIPSEEYTIEFEYSNWKGFVIRMQKDYEYQIFKKLTTAREIPEICLVVKQRPSELTVELPTPEPLAEEESVIIIEDSKIET